MIILEGTDAVGKTSVKNNLCEYELLDRDKEVCKLFDFNISLNDRAIKLNKYLINSKNYVIFLINNDREELERRVYKREVIDEYDKYAYLYNLLYLETYLYMEQSNLLNNQLFILDCTGLNITEQTEKVRKLVKQISKNMIK